MKFQTFQFQFQTFQIRSVTKMDSSINLLITTHAKL